MPSTKLDTQALSRRREFAVHQQALHAFHTFRKEIQIIWEVAIRARFIEYLLWPKTRDQLMMRYIKSGKADRFIFHMIYRHAVDEEAEDQQPSETDMKRMREMYWQILWPCDGADPCISPQLMADILAAGEHLFPPLRGYGGSKEMCEKLVRECIPQARDGRVEYLNSAGKVDCFGWIRKINGTSVLYTNEALAVDWISLARTRVDSLLTDLTRDDPTYGEQCLTPYVKKAALSLEYFCSGLEFTLDMTQYVQFPGSEEVSTTSRSESPTSDSIEVNSVSSASSAWSSATRSSGGVPTSQCATIY